MTNWEAKRRRKAEVKARAGEPSGMFSRCRVIGCGKPARAGTDDGLDTRFCRSHSDLYARHGSPYQRSFTALQIAPYRAAALAWLDDNQSDIYVANAIERVATLLRTAGPHIEAFRLRGRSPEERAKAAWARLRKAKVDPRRAVAAWLAVEMIVRDDPQAERKADRGFILVDGWHRTKATEAIGLGYIDAQVITGAHPDEYLWIAAQANLKHGKRLKPKERREAFRAYVKAGGHRKPGKKRDAVRVKPAREMARDLGGMISARTIPTWMRKDFPSVYRLMREAGEFVETGTEFGKPSPDDYYAKNAEEALQQLVANFRAIKGDETRQRILAAMTRAASDAAKVLTGTADLPVVFPDEF